MDEMKLIPVFPEDIEWLSRLKAGDRVTRWLAGLIPMPLEVTAVRDGVIECGDWTFSHRNGAELDDDLGWGEAVSGSYIRPPSH